MKDIKLDFPHQDDNLWLEIEVGGHKAYQYPSPLEVKMLISEAVKQREEKIIDVIEKMLLENPADDKYDEERAGFRQALKDLLKHIQ